MSRKRSDEAMAAYAVRFVDGAVANGVPRETAERVFEQIRGFSGFGFPKSHAAAFGLLAYQSTWLRVHRGPEFLCALLNEQPMGFYPPDALVHEAQRRGIELEKPDVNRSGVDCRVERVGEGDEDLVVQIGLGYVNGLRKDDATAVVSERERSGRFCSLAELASRAGIRDDALGRLAWAGACESIEPDSEGARREARRIALWRLGVASGAGPRGQLSLPLPLPDAPELRELDDWEVAVADYASTGMTLGTHPVALLRDELDGVVPNADLAVLPDRRALEIAGVVVARQRPGTAKGDRLHAARGRDGSGERDRAAARLHGVPPGGAHRGVRAGGRAAGAPREGDQRPGEEHQPACPCRASRRRRCARSNRIRCARRAATSSRSSRHGWRLLEHWPLLRLRRRASAAEAEMDSCPSGFCGDSCKRSCSTRAPSGSVLIVPNPCSNQRHRSGTA